MYTASNKNIQQILNVQNLPATFLIDRKGQIIAQKEGLADWNGLDVNIQIRNALKKDPLPIIERPKRQEIIDGRLDYGIRY